MNKKLSKEDILSLAKEKGVKLSFLNELIGGYRGKLTDWKNNKTSLTEDEKNIIVDYLFGKDVSIDNITKNKAIETTNDEAEVLNMYRQLTPDEKITIRKIMKGIHG